MSNNKPQTPITYLWNELDTLLSDATIAELRRRYEAHKRAYDRAAKIRRLQRQLAELEVWVRTKRNAALIERTKARLKALEDEQNVIE